MSIAEFNMERKTGIETKGKGTQNNTGMLSRQMPDCDS